MECPYNRAHQIMSFRMQTHLYKCRKNHKDLKFVKCPFNETHDLPEPELKYHKTVCPDRETFDRYKYCIRTTAATFVAEQDHPTEEPRASYGMDGDADEETWDQVPGMVKSRPVLKITFVFLFFSTVKSRRTIRGLTRLVMPSFGNAPEWPRPKRRLSKRQNASVSPIWAIDRARTRKIIRIPVSWACFARFLFLLVSETVEFNWFSLLSLDEFELAKKLHLQQTFSQEQNVTFLFPITE